jgi:hypothetical protein
MSRVIVWLIVLLMFTCSFANMSHTVPLSLQCVNLLFLHPASQLCLPVCTVLFVSLIA